MKTSDLPHIIRRAMPYVVDINSKGVIVEGREYQLLMQIPKEPSRMPTEKMLSRWPCIDPYGSAKVRLGKKSATFWFYDDGGRDIMEYVKALRDFGKWLERVYGFSWLYSNAKGHYNLLYPYEKTIEYLEKCQKSEQDDWDQLKKLHPTLASEAEDEMSGPLGVTRKRSTQEHLDRLNFIREITGEINGKTNYNYKANKSI